MPSCSGYAHRGDRAPRAGAGSPRPPAHPALPSVPRRRLRPGSHGDERSVDRNFLLALALSFAVLALWTIYTERRRRRPKPRRGDRRPRRRRPRRPPAPGAAPPAPRHAARRRRRARRPRRLRRAGAAEEQRVTARDGSACAPSSRPRGGALVHWELRDYDDAYQPGRPRVELTTFDATATVALFTPFDALGSRRSPLRARTRSSSRTRRACVSRASGRRRASARPTASSPTPTAPAPHRDRERHGAPLRPTFRVGWPIVGRTTPRLDGAQRSPRYVDGSLEHIRQRGPAARRDGLLSGGSGEPIEYPADVDWAGADTRYFLTAMIPDVPRDAAAASRPRTGSRAAWSRSPSAR